MDLTNYEGREQAYIKHYLLQKYLSSWGFKIGSKWDPLVFIDGFAGPWGTRDADFADASFGIAMNSLRNAVNGLERIDRRINAACIFVEREPQPFLKLDAFAKSHSTSRVKAIALRGRFSENIPAIEQYVSSLGPNAFKFVFLDQKGWAATPLDILRPFVQTRSCELLFTVMTSFLSRFLDRDGIESSYDSLFGRPDVLQRIRKLPKGTGVREEAIVEEYCSSLRHLCGFQHVSQAVILEPTKERVRYFMVFATNSLHGIEVFKQAESETNVTQDKVRYETISRKLSQSFLPFGDQAPKSTVATSLQSRYRAKAAQRLLTKLVMHQNRFIPYSDLYDEFLSFPIVNKVDLDETITRLQPAVKFNLEGARRRVPSPFKRDIIQITNPEVLQQELRRRVPLDEFD